jgi:hypothetical protein
MELMQTAGPRLVVAGGFIRACIAREPVNDVDVFTQTPADAQLFADLLAVKRGHKPYTTENAHTIRGRGLPVQFIHRWTFEVIEQLIASFDFTIARAAIWFDKPEPPGVQQLWGKVDPHFYADLAGRRLVYCSPTRKEEAGGSLLRVLKFYQRGYRIPLDSLGAVLGRLLMGVDEPNWQKRATMIPDVWAGQMGHVLTQLLREVDPAIDPNHLAHEPSLADRPEDAPLTDAAPSETPPAAILKGGYDGRTNADVP